MYKYIFRRVFIGFFGLVVIMLFPVFESRAYEFVSCENNFNSDETVTTKVRLSTDKKDGGFSFRGKPKNEASVFLITEVGIAKRLKESHSPVSHITWDIGAMLNVSSKVALGGNLYISYDDTFDKAFLFGFKSRSRYWLSDRLHCDLAAGLLLTENRIDRYRGYDSRTYPSFIGHAGIGYGDWFSLTLQREEIRCEREWTPKSNWYIGISVGSYIGTIVSPISFVLVAFARHLGD